MKSQQYHTDRIKMVILPLRWLPLEIRFEIYSPDLSYAAETFWFNETFLNAEDDHYGRYTAFTNICLQFYAFFENGESSQEFRDFERLRRSFWTRPILKCHDEMLIRRHLQALFTFGGCYDSLAFR